MKSAYELAMERLDPQTPVPSLTDEQRQQLAEIDQRFKARIAEREFNLRGHLAKARREGDYLEVRELEQQLQRELARLHEQAEEAKQQVRNAASADVS